MKRINRYGKSMTTQQGLTAQEFRAAMVAYNQMMDAGQDTSSATVEEKDNLLVWEFISKDGYQETVQYNPSKDYLVHVLVKPRSKDGTRPAMVDFVQHGTIEQLKNDQLTMVY